MTSLDLAFNVLARDVSASKTFDKVGDSAGRLSKAGVAVGSAIGNLAANGITAGLGAIKNFAAGSVDAFAAVEDATGAAGVQFGAALPEVTAFAEGAFKAFGLSKRAALDAQNSFGTLGKSAGLSGRDLSGFASNLTGLAGDLASFKGTSTEQAIEAVGAALRGEAEPIRAYGVLLDDATLRQEALSLGLIKTTKEALTPQQKVLASQSAILKQTTDAQGDFARTSDSTANTQKRLQAATENASAQLGEKLAPIVTTVRGKFLEFITALTDTDGVTQRKVVPALRSMSEKLGEVKDFVERNSGVIVPLVATLGTFAAGIVIVTQVVKAYTAVQAALNLVLTLNPIGLVVLAIAALVAGIVIAYKNSETFRNVIQTVFREVAQFVIAGVDKVLGALQAMANAASKLPGPLGAPFKSAAEAIGGVRDKLAGLSNDLDSLGRKKANPSITIAGVGAAEEAIQRLERRITNIGGTQVRIPVAVGGGRAGGVQERADGGPVRAGQPYLVGERGPELIVPPRNGFVLTADQTRAAAGSSTASYTINTVESDPVRIVNLLRRMETLNA